MNVQRIVEILKKHCANYGDKHYEPSQWIVNAMQEAFEIGRTPESTKTSWLLYASICVEVFTDDAVNNEEAVAIFQRRLDEVKGFKKGYLTQGFSL